MSRMVVCRECGEEKKHKAKGMCAKCYQLRMLRNPVRCLGCAHIRTEKANGLCKSCYAKAAICSECGAQGQVVGNGLCVNCYRRWLRKANPGRDAEATRRYVERNRDQVNRKSRERYASGVRYAPTIVVCVECKQEKKLAGSGLCHACHKRRARRLYPEREKATKQRYLQKYPERQRNYERRWRSEHPNYQSPAIVICSRCGEERSHFGLGLCKSCHHKTWSENNVEKVREYGRKHGAKYRSLPHYKKRQRIYQQQYRIRYPEKMRLKSARRRSLIHSLPYELTDEQWNAILNAYNFKCAYCGKRSKKLTMDHVIPLVRHQVGTVPSNIVPACRSCNSAKRDRDPVKLPAVRLML